MIEDQGQEEGLADEPVSVVTDGQQPYVIINRRTLLRAVTAFALAVVVAFALIGWVAYRSYSNGSTAQDAADTAQSAANQAKSEIATGRAARLANQAAQAKRLAELDAAIKQAQSSGRDLACSIALYTRTSPPYTKERAAFAQFLYSRYACQGFQPGRPAGAFQPSSSTTPVPSPQPSSGTGTPSQPASRSRAPGSSRAPSAPAPRTSTSTRTVVAPAPAPSTSRGLVPDLLCRVLLTCPS